MMKKSWVCTFVTQFSLCLSLFLVLNLCQHQKLIIRNRNVNNLPMDIYFISVTGGIRNLEEQALLLKQVEKVAKKFNARFVISISELGENDPLTQNWQAPGSIYYRNMFTTLSDKRIHLKFPMRIRRNDNLTSPPVHSLAGYVAFSFHEDSMPSSTCRYSTLALRGQGVNHYLKQFKFAHGSLDIIVVDTGLYEVASNGAGEGQSQWLIDTLENSESKWRIAIGFHPLVACEEDTSQIKLKHEFQSLHGVFLKYGVDAFISGQDCVDNIEERPIAKSNSGTARYKGPLLTKVNQNLPYSMEKVNGFLLHKVSALEIVSYLVTLEGDVVQKIFLHQRGKDIM